MAYRQLPDGRWYVTYWQDGRQRRTYCGRGEQGRKLAISEDHRIKSLKALEKRQAGPREFTYRQVAERYLTAKGSPADTRRALAQLSPAFGNKPCSRLSLRDLAEALVPMTCSGARKNRLAAYARAVLGWGVRHGYLRANPFAGYQPYREPPHRPRLFTVEELRRLLDVAEGHLQRIVVLALYTISRPGPTELLSLRWSDIDWQGNTIRVAQGKTGQVKIVPLADTLRRCLECWAKEGQEGYLITYRGRPVRQFKRAWARALELAGVPFRCPYTIRHCGITWMLAEGADLRTVSQIAGHSSVKMTADRYYWDVAEMQQKAAAVAKLPAF